MAWYRQIFQTAPGEGVQETASPKPANPDTLIFERFLAGDDSALVELYDRHNHRIFMYCRQFVRDHQRAEDITQELWERVIRLRRERKVTSQNPMGFLLTIARNLCLDELRKDRHHTAIEDLPETSHPVDSIPELSHMEELVVLALPHLPASQREVLVLNAYSGYRFDEIAEMLGEPVGAIRTRAWRARTHLARMISAMIGIEEDKQTTRPHNRQESGQ